MKISKLYKPLMSGLLCTLLLSGFTGKEKYIELEGLANGRSSANFKRSGNVLTTLPRGTQGEIIKSTRLRSGNYGLKIKILNGPNAGRTMWVYHRMNGDSTLALYKKIPSSWNSSSPTQAKSEDRQESRSEEKQNRTTEPKRAVATLTIRETRTVIENKETPVATETTAATENSASNEDMTELSALTAINETNKRLRNEKTEDEECSECTITSSGSRSLLRRGPHLALRCENFVNSQGQIGSRGQLLYSIMTEPQNFSYYTKNNALGSICPNFKNLSSSEKLHVWTWFWTVLAHVESRCDEKVFHAETYVDSHHRIRQLNPTTGIGLWALEERYSDREWRGTECRSVAGVENQARCAISIMRDTQLKTGDTALDSRSYWGPIRRYKKQLSKYMARITLCSPN